MEWLLLSFYLLFHLDSSLYCLSLSLVLSLSFISLLLSSLVFWIIRTDREGTSKKKRNEKGKH